MLAYSSPNAETHSWNGAAPTAWERERLQGWVGKQGDIAAGRHGNHRNVPKKGRNRGAEETLLKIHTKGNGRQRSEGAGQWREPSQVKAEPTCGQSGRVRRRRGSFAGTCNEMKNSAAEK